MCGTTIPSVITSVSNTLTVNFKSDYIVNRKGFSVDYTSLDQRTGKQYFNVCIFFYLYFTDIISDI